jgi:hypothetical protein
VLNLITMNRHRLPKSTRGRDPRREDDAGSSTRRKSSQPALPPLAAPPAAKHDPELETRLFMIVTAVSENEGMTYPPEWAGVVDAAKRRQWLAEKGLHLHLTTHGRQWLATRAGPSKGRSYEMTKIRLHDRLKLKDLSRDTSTPMQEVIGHVIGAIHEHRDELTRVARSAGEEHPWEGVRALIRGARKA